MCQGKFLSNMVSVFKKKVVKQIEINLNNLRVLFTLCGKNGFEQKTRSSLMLYVPIKYTFRVVNVKANGKEENIWIHGGDNLYLLVRFFN